MNPLIGRTCYRKGDPAQTGIICHIDRLDGEYVRAGEAEHRDAGEIVLVVLMPGGALELWRVWEITVQ